MAGPIQQINRYSSFRALTIAISTSASDAFDAREFAAFGVVIPAAFTGTTITLQVSADNVTYQALHKNSSDVAWSITVQVSKSYALPTDLEAWPFFKIVSGGTEAAARTLYVVGKG